MYSFNVKADSLIQLGQRLEEAAKMFLAEQVFTDHKQTSFNFTTTPVLEPEEVSQISISEMRAKTEVKRTRKPRTTKSKDTQVNSSPVSELAETPSVTSTSESVSANTYTREQLTAKLNAFLEHKDGGIQAARDLLKSFGASKMSDISDEGIEAVIIAINAVIGN
jgi:hypothetical protein